eukprot:6212596-Pleurochrysis_carterae.AAC.8
MAAPQCETGSRQKSSCSLATYWVQPVKRAKTLAIPAPHTHTALKRQTDVDDCSPSIALVMVRWYENQYEEDGLRLVSSFSTRRTGENCACFKACLINGSCFFRLIEVQYAKWVEDNL